ncbi:hypothetical protein BJ138DRAFT_1119116 [Hygrophoropsis aurantiaca]|uniref:Uncharacterized protein n=1 Tax=Hygrophoropsis aurantiaca TaxID=72124 RepID=A0ACB7ZUX0_9AGAM|nr:hypothetical protein BJ138DRAFT_1119116 [Hygrophoropsis aurantiaca]
MNIAHLRRDSTPHLSPTRNTTATHSVYDSVSGSDSDDDYHRAVHGVRPQVVVGALRYPSHAFQVQPMDIDMPFIEEPLPAIEHAIWPSVPPISQTSTTFFALEKSLQDQNPDPTQPSDITAPVVSSEPNPGLIAVTSPGAVTGGVASAQDTEDSTADITAAGTLNTKKIAVEAHTTSLSETDGGGISVNGAYQMEENQGDSSSQWTDGASIPLSTALQDHFRTPFWGPKTLSIIFF